MGKTRTKLIDDSVAEGKKPQTQLKPKKITPKKEQDSLVAKLKEELGIKEESEGRLPPSAASSRRGAGGDERTRGPELVEGPQGVSTEGAVSEQTSGVADRSKKTQKPGKSKPRSKKYQEVSKDLDRSKTYPIPEAIDLVKKTSYSKFPGTLEAHINTTVTGVRGLISLPYASGKKITVLAFGKGAQGSGADIIGTDQTIEEIAQGKIKFDILVTTPEWMSKLAKVARILGPRGLMPSPKNGTITSNEPGLKKTVEGFQEGKTEYKTESKAPVIHLGLGKLSQPTAELEANVKTLLQTLGKTRISKVTLSPTMGAGVKLDLNSI